MNPVVATPVMETEVTEKAKRRRFTAEFKKSVLEEADKLEGTGQIAALLRRKGLYSSHLLTWRQQREAGELAGLAPKNRGPKAKQKDPLAEEVAQLQRKLAVTEARLKKAEAIISIQKKVSEMLGVELPEVPSEEEGS